MLIPITFSNGSWILKMMTSKILCCSNSWSISFTECFRCYRISFFKNFPKLYQANKFTEYAKFYRFFCCLRVLAYFTNPTMFHIFYILNLYNNDPIFLSAIFDGFPEFTCEPVKLSVGVSPCTGILLYFCIILRRRSKPYRPYSWIPLSGWGRGDNAHIFASVWGSIPILHAPRTACPWLS